MRGKETFHKGGVHTQVLTATLFRIKFFIKRGGAQLQHASVIFPGWTLQIMALFPAMQCT